MTSERKSPGLWIGLMAAALLSALLLLWPVDQAAGPSIRLDQPRGEVATGSEPESIRRQPIETDPPDSADFHDDRPGRRYVPPTGPATLAGRIVDDAGRPQAEAAVSVMSIRVQSGSRESPLAEGRTGTDGRFRFEGLDPDEAYLVWARKEGFLPVSSEPKKPGAGETLDLGDLSLTTPCTVAGKVVDPAGRPIPDATVLRLIPRALPGTVTDLEGRFTLGGLPPGKTTIGAEAPGYIGRSGGSVSRTSQQQLVVRRGEQHEELLLVLHPEGVIRGTIVGLDGAPLVEELFRISARGNRGSVTGTVATAYTEGGACVLSGLDPDLTYDLFAEGLSGRTQTRKDVRCGGEPVMFQLAPWPTIQIAVRSAADGASLQAASIALYRGAELVCRHMPSFWTGRQISDPPEPFMLPFREAGSYKFYVSKKGYEVFRSDPLLLDGHSSHGPVVVLLRERSPAAAEPGLTGVVLRAGSREPLPNVKVLRRAMQFPDSTMGRIHGVLVGGLSSATGGPTTRTDREGRFSFEPGFTPTSLVLKDARYSSGRLDLPRGSPTFDLELPASEHGAVEGRVVLVNGAPGVGLPIVAHRPNLAPRTTRTDGQGSYRLAPLLPGPWKISVGNPYARANRPLPSRFTETTPAIRLDLSVTITVPEGHFATADIDLRMLGAAIEGTVTAGGRQGTKVSISLTPAGADAKNPLSQLVIWIGADGGYGFPGVPPGRYRLSVHASRGNALLAEATVSLLRGQTARQDFDVRLGALNVTVLAQETDQPLPGVLVSGFRIPRSGAPIARRPTVYNRTDSDGLALLKGLTADEFWVLIKTDRGALGRAVSVPPGKTRDVTFQVPPPTTMQIHLDNSRAPESTSIRIAFWSRGRLLFDHHVQNPLATSTLTLENIQPAEYELRAVSSPGGEAAVGTIEVSPGAANALSLLLEPKDPDDPEH